MKTSSMRCMPAAPVLRRCTQSFPRNAPREHTQGVTPARVARAVLLATAARQRSVRAASRFDDSDETSEDDIKLDDDIDDLLAFSVDVDAVLGAKGTATSSTARRLRSDLAADDDLDLDLDAIISAAENGAGEPGSQSEGDDDYGDEAGASTSGGQGSGDDGEGGGGGGGGRNEYPPRPERSYGLRELLRAAGCGAAAETAPDLAIRNIMTCNSETAAPGSLYVCVPSTDAGDDGHEWAAEAVELGAVAVLAERPLPDVGVPVVLVDSALGVLGALGSAFYAAPSAQVRTVGLVGSYGKTTSAWLMRGMFEEAGELTGMLGSIEYAIAEDRLTAEGEVWEPDEDDPSLRRDSSTPFHGIPYQGKYGCPETTPDALHLQKTLAGMVERGATTVLAELCPTAAADGRCDALVPEILVFTNVFPERATAGAGASAAAAGSGSGAEATAIGFAEDSVEAYVERVASMFDRLTDPERQRAVVNIDDAHGPAIAARAEAAGAAVLTFAVDDKAADVTVEKVKSSIWETELMVVTPLGRLQIIVPLLGKMHTYNVLAAVAVGITAGVPLKAIVAGIEAVDIIPGRSEIVDEGQQFTIMVDAARSPEALSRLLDDVKECGGKRTLLVIGCPGDTTREHRAAIGQVAHFKAEAVFLTNDNPGRGFPDEIIADIVSGLPEEVHSRHAGSVYPWLQDQHRVPQWFEKILLQYQSEVQRYIVEDRFSAIRVAVGMAKKGDVVLVVGKGHEDFQEYWDGITEGSTVKAWFDDRVECRNAVSKLGYLNSLKDFDRAFLPWTRYPEERELLITAGIADAEDPDALSAI